METTKKPVFEKITFQEIVNTPTLYRLQPLNNDELPYKFNIFINKKGNNYFFSGFIYDDDEGFLDSILGGYYFNDEATCQEAFNNAKEYLYAKYFTRCIQDEIIFFKKYFSKKIVNDLIKLLKNA